MPRLLVVVAHPDDESLWAGGYLAAHPGTHVLCCSIPARDPERCEHFFRACNILRAEGYICGRMARSGTVDIEAAQRVAWHYDWIITHNEVGEYGHPAHRAVHEAMKALGKPMRVFGYGLTGEGELIDYDKKVKAISCYKSRPKVLSNQSKLFNLRRETFL